VSTTDDLRKALAEDDGSLPERWNPNDEPGTSLVGTFLRYETIVTEFGESNIAVIEDMDDGTVWGVALFRTVLKKRFEALAPQPGDTLGVKYVGFAEPRNKDARGYHNYVVRIIRNAAGGQSALAADARTDSGGDDELPF
jgi:hypothetical protein